MDGISFRKKKSRPLLNSLSLPWWEVLLLIGGGILAVVLHEFLRLPLGLPGRHGVEWMALLLLGRASSRFRGAASLSGASAALTSLLPFWRGDDPFAWLAYLLPGLVLDAAYRLWPQSGSKAWFIILLGGLAHATKPVLRLMLNLLAGFPFGSFRYGVLYPIWTHLLFGLIGGMLAVLIVWGIKQAGAKSAD